MEPKWCLALQPILRKQQDQLGPKRQRNEEPAKLKVEHGLSGLAEDPVTTQYSTVVHLVLSRAHLGTYALLSLLIWDLNHYSPPGYFAELSAEQFVKATLLRAAALS